MTRPATTAFYAAVLVLSAGATANPGGGDALHLYRIIEYRPGETVGRLIYGGPWVRFEDCIRAAQEAIRFSPIGTEAECSLTSLHEGEGRDA